MEQHKVSPSFYAELLRIRKEISVWGLSMRCSFVKIDGVNEVKVCL